MKSITMTNIKEYVQTLNSIDNTSIEDINDEDLKKCLYVSYLLRKKTEEFESLLKQTVVERTLETDYNDTYGLKMTVKTENDKEEVDVQKVYTSLSLSDFIPLVKVVKSNATNAAQKQAIANAAIFIPGKKLMVEIRKLSMEDKKKMKLTA